MAINYYKKERSATPPRQTMEYGGVTRKALLYSRLPFKSERQVLEEVLTYEREPDNASNR
jgi:hypothetical protein